MVIDIDTCIENIKSMNADEMQFHSEVNRDNRSEIPTGSIVKNDLGVREFEEIVVEYPPEDLCTYPEYKGKPYFSIKYKEGNDCFIGYGTYKPKVFSRYLRDYFIPSVTPQEPRWIPVSERLPEIQNYSGNYLVTLKSGGVHIGMFIERNGKHWWTHYDDVVAWMPLPKPYEPQESEKV